MLKYDLKPEQAFREHPCVDFVRLFLSKGSILKACLKLDIVQAAPACQGVYEYAETWHSPLQ